MSHMTRNELPDEKKKEYDEIVARCMKEIEENAIQPEKDSLDLRPDQIRRSITQKYLPLLEKILIEAEEQQNLIA